MNMVTYKRWQALVAIILITAFSIVYIPQWIRTPQNNSNVMDEIDEALLAELDEIIIENNNGASQADSLIVYYRNQVIHERYFKQYMTNASKVHIYSCTKSLISALIGIAINEGSIGGIDDRVLDYFPGLQIDNWDERKETITIRHLISMTSGLGWDDNINWNQMSLTRDWVEYVFSRPMVADPGTVFQYNSGGFHVLSALLTEATGMTAEEYATEYLFSWIGVSDDDYWWSNDPQGNSIGGTLFHMTVPAMARFGLLYLNNGIWDGNQLISLDWVSESTRTQFSDTFWPWEYGYGWWVFDVEDGFSALGSHGQMIFVSPENELVVVFTGSGSDDFLNLSSYIEEYIIPSLH
jgi:CubicO group peptidase (beta-lactamase class C family)